MGAGFRRGAMGRQPITLDLAHVFALGLALVLALVVVPGCKKPDANDWARERYGSGADELRRETTDAFRRAEGVAGGLQPTASGGLPRPYLVFKVPYGAGDWETLDVHRVSATLEPAPAASSVQGFAVVRYTQNFTYEGTVHVRGGGKVVEGTYREVMLVTVIDRRSNVASQIVVSGSDDRALLDVLERLPTTAPDPPPSPGGRSSSKHKHRGERDGTPAEPANAP